MPTTTYYSTTTKNIETPAEEPLVQPSKVLINQSKIATLRSQNEKLENKMKVITHQYGRLVDQLSSNTEYNEIK